VKPGERAGWVCANGLPTNGYTARAEDPVRRAGGLEIDSRIRTFAATVGEVLLAVHRSYYRVIQPVLPMIHALAHITGGGIPATFPIAPGRLPGVVQRTAGMCRRCFRTSRRGRSPTTRCTGVQHGVGMIAIVAPENVDAVRAPAKRRHRDVGSGKRGFPETE